MTNVMCHLREARFGLSNEKESGCLWQDRFYRELTITTPDNYVRDEITFFLSTEQAKALADTIYEALGTEVN